jgi:hypothetical protein
MMTCTFPLLSPHELNYTMAEVVAAFAALSSFLQVVQFTAKLAKEAGHLYTEGRKGSEAAKAEEDNRTLESLTQEYKDLSQQLQKLCNTDHVGDDERLLFRQQRATNREAENYYTCSKACRFQALRRD